MTDKEALDELIRNIPEKVFGTELYCEAYDIALKALEKQIANKVEIVLHENRIPSEREEPYCPTCEEWLGWDSRDTKYCYNCGQRIDWSDDE